MRKFKTTDASSTPAEMSFPKAPGCFAIHVKYARIGENNANTVQPMMKLSPYTPCVRMATA